MGRITTWKWNAESCNGISKGKEREDSQGDEDETRERDNKLGEEDKGAGSEKEQDLELILGCIVWIQ